MNEMISPFDPTADREPLVELWQRIFNYDSPHNNPHLAIDKKLATNDGLLFVAKVDGKVVGSVMAGYDGHRGWIYSLAVLPEHRNRGLGSRLVRHAEARLKSLGCPKINLQILKGNDAVAAFYQKLGYAIEARISMGKRIPENIRSAGQEPGFDQHAPPTYSIRPLLISDYEAVYQLWRQSDGICLQDDDQRDRIELYLRRNPGLCYVAVLADRIVGSILCGHDGRRAILRHLAVEKPCRNQGIARELIAKVLASLREQGVRKCNIYVQDDNGPGLKFWEHIGARLVVYDWRTFQIQIDP